MLMARIQVFIWGTIQDTLFQMSERHILFQLILKEKVLLMVITLNGKGQIVHQWAPLLFQIIGNVLEILFIYHKIKVHG